LLIAYQSQLLSVAMTPVHEANRELEEENEQLRSELDQMKTILTDNKLRAKAGALIPHYRLAVVTLV